MEEGLAAIRRLLPNYLRSPYSAMNAMEVSRLARRGQLVEVEGTAFSGAARRKKAINPAKLMKPGQLWDLHFPIGAGKTTSAQSCWEQGIRYQNWIFVSGQLPVANNGRLWGRDLRTQITKVHENIREVIKAGGGKFDRDVIYIGWFSQTLNMEQSLALPGMSSSIYIKARFRPLWLLKRPASYCPNNVINRARSATLTVSKTGIRHTCYGRPANHHGCAAE